MRQRTPYVRRDPIPGIPIAAPNGVILGFLQGECLVRYLRSSVHMLRVPHAWTIDKEAFDKMRATYRVTKIMIFDKDARRGQPQGYSIEIEDWDAHVGEINRGKYDQYFVTIPNWKTW